MPALGTGGFGAVYRGHLPLSAGREIEAVAKIYSAAGDQGAAHMKRESRAMRMLQESGAEGRGCVLQMYAAGMHPSENRPMLLVELASSCLYDSLVSAGAGGIGVKRTYRMSRQRGKEDYACSPG